MEMGADILQIDRNGLNALGHAKKSKAPDKKETKVLNKRKKGRPGKKKKSRRIERHKNKDVIDYLYLEMSKSVALEIMKTDHEFSVTENGEPIVDGRKF